MKPAPRTLTAAAALRIGLRAMSQYPWLSVVFLATTVGQGALQGGLVWSLRIVLQQFTAGGATVRTLFLGALLIFGLWILRALSTFAGEVVSVRLARRVEVNSLQRLLRKLLTLSVRFFERSSQGDLITASYRDLQAMRSVVTGLGTIALAVFRLVGLGAVALLMSPSLAVVGFVAVIVGVVPARFLGQRITSAAREERGAIQSLYDTLLQVISGIRVIKVNRLEAALGEQADSIGERMYRHAVRQAQMHSLARLLLEAVSGLGLIAILVVGGRDVAVGKLDWQTLLSLLVAVVAMYVPVVNLLSVWGGIRQAIPHLDRVDAVFGLQSDLRDAPDARPLTQTPGVIKLEGVSYAYNDILVLDSISISFRRGETIGIVGPSGAGKSTLIALLLRLYDPTAGRILLDGVDLRQIRHADFLDRCALVPQEPFLFMDSIGNNIRLGRPDATQEEVIAAARAVQVHDEIMATERGYQTVVGSGEEARGLSVGQKQRIVIAAALLKDAPLLFLDEATSNLDAVSERAVQRAVGRLMAGRTTFVIAHRLATVQRADRILVLERGRVAGFGPHDELLQTCAVYRHLYESQQAVEPAAQPAVEDALSETGTRAGGS